MTVGVDKAGGHYQTGSIDDLGSPLQIRGNAGDLSVLQGHIGPNAGLAGAIQKKTAFDDHIKHTANLLRFSSL